MKAYWVSAYTMYGSQFGATILATDVDELFNKFHEEFEDADIADYGCDEEESLEWPSRWWEPGCEDMPAMLPEEQWLPDDMELPFR